MLSMAKVNAIYNVFCWMMYCELLRISVEENVLVWEKRMGRFGSGRLRYL